jgi:phage repressor protein C with HTH and peptisase S24 domain
MTNFGQRVKDARMEVKMTQKALGYASGLSQTTIANIESGRNKGSGDVVALARALKVSPEWLAEGRGQKRSSNATNVIATFPDAPVSDDEVRIKEYKVHFSAGAGRHASFELVEESEPATYRRSWFQRERIKPENARRFKVSGDSMEPFLYAGDSVLVNLAENDPAQIRDGKVYAIRYGDDLRIKRLFRRLDGTLTLRSDNPAYKDEDVPPELAQEHIAIIGRVRDKSGAGGL